MHTGSSCQILTLADDNNSAWFRLSPVMQLAPSCLVFRFLHSITDLIEVRRNHQLETETNYWIQKYGIWRRVFERGLETTINPASNEYLKLVLGTGVFPTTGIELCNIPVFVYQQTTVLIGGSLIKHHRDLIGAHLISALLESRCVNNFGPQVESCWSENNWTNLSNGGLSMGNWMNALRCVMRTEERRAALVSGVVIIDRFYGRQHNAHKSNQSMFWVGRERIKNLLPSNAIINENKNGGPFRESQTIKVSRVHYFYTLETLNSTR